MFVGERINYQSNDVYQPIHDISCESESIQSLNADNEDMYIHLPSKNNRVDIANKRESLNRSSIKSGENTPSSKRNEQDSPKQAEVVKSLRYNSSRLYNLVGCLESDAKKRLMITIQPNLTLKHLSSQIGQQMQRHRAFENLLGLRACELKVIKCMDKNKGNETEGHFHSKNYPFLLHSHKSANEFKVDSEEDEEVVGDAFHDGDEFVFKLESHDKWIKVVIRFQLKGFRDIKFTAQLEIKVGKDLQNAQLFNIIQKLTIEVWNQAIETKRGKKDLYVLNGIRFYNKKIVKERVDQENEDATKLIYAKSGGTNIISFNREVKRERAKLDINKKNSIEVTIDPEKKVDDTFGYDGCMVVDAVFNTLTKEANHQKKHSKDFLLDTNLHENNEEPCVSAS